MNGQSPLRVLVVDDEPLARQELAFLLGEIGGVDVVGEARDAGSALRAAEQHAPDGAFVDVRMPGPDGLVLAEALRRRHPGLGIVVVSAHDEALRAFEAGVVDYLLKPVRLERLRTAVERLREARAPERTPTPLVRLAVRRKDRWVVVEIDDVVWFEVRDELVWAVTDQDRFALDPTLTALEQQLPPGVFFRCHRQFLVRVDRIRAIAATGTGGYELLVDHPSGARLPLARDRLRALRAIIPVAG
ncbi:MAG: LytTR family DNA-binding domain-containing protein [Myxococcota bacterium]|nr:LytTR family DNA-binding domain-containing protein [Myxococcota bacterium]